MSRPATPIAASDRPLAINLLLGVSGWVAGAFTLLFVAQLFRPESAGQAAISGTFLLAAAWGLFKVDGDGEQIFVAQLALALSIAGQFLLLFAMTRHAHGIASIAGAALLLQAGLAIAMPNRLSRVLSTLFATIAWALTLHFALYGEPGDGNHGGVADPASLPVALAGWLLAWLPVGAALGWAIRTEAAWAARGWATLLRPIVTGLILGLAFATLASQPFESADGLGGGAAGAGSQGLWPLLSALGALVALTAAFALRRRGLMALCAIAALLHVGHFYWVLGCSLLLKSVLMLAMGIVFVLAARGLRSKEAA